MTLQVHFLEISQLESLTNIFDQTFAKTYSTILLGGGDEPVYIPSQKMGEMAKIIFTQDYFASALHEVAHWCVAGEHRRQLIDYGYWYVPDGRNSSQQKAFEQVEVKPQALEWIFSVASRHKFCISADNLGALEGAMPGVMQGASNEFKFAVWQCVLTFCRNGLPKRAAQFVEGLLLAFNTDQFDPLLSEHYDLTQV